MAENLDSRLVLEQVLETFAGFDLDRFGYPRDDDWALPWETLQLVARMAEVLQPRRMIEFGSGRSTEVLATVLQEYGGRLLSFDHKAEYAQWAADAVRARGLGGVASVVHRRSTLRRYGAKVLPFYSIRWEQFKEFSKCELVLVDGPPFYIGREAVLYEVFHHLGVGGWAVLDDMNREAYERRWVESWKRVFGESLEVRVFPAIGKGVGLLFKRAEGSPNYKFGWPDVWESWQHSTRSVIRSLRARLTEDCEIG